MTASGRHPNVLIGILLAAVVVLAFVALIGLGTPAPTTDPTPAASASITQSLTSPAPSSRASSSAESSPAAPVIPSTTEIAPGVLADCGRTAPAACEKAITLARASNEADLVGTTLVVVDDICAPEVICDRMWAFDSMVGFVTAGGDTTGWYAFHAFGLDASMPTDAEPWPDEIPSHVVDRIRAALASP